MIEEQAGIEVIEQVDAKAQAALFHQQELTALGQPSVLGAALGLVACLERDAFARHCKCLTGHAHELAQARAGGVLGDFARRRVFLHMQPGLRKRVRSRRDRRRRVIAADHREDVDRRRIVGQIGIVGTPAGDAFTGELFALVA